MRERPILFSGPMVRAILSGQKTQTRRLVRLPRRPLNSDQRLSQPSRLPSDRGRSVVVNADGRARDTAEIISNPYGVPGDRLWVRETWRPLPYHTRGAEGCDCDDVVANYAADKGEPGTRRVLTPAADWRFPQAAKRGMVPAIHMPRWASRIDLEIVAVRVERLRDLSRDDARAEGVESLDRYHEHLEFLSSVGGGTGDAEIEVFRSLWNEINGDRAAWESNPWCWVVEFKRVQP